MRRIIDKRNAVWAALPDAGKTRVRQALWRAFTDEGDGAVLRALAHAVAKASDGWADLLPRLLQMLGATQDATRQAAVFFLLEQMAEFSSELTKDGATMNSVGPALQTALAAGGNAAAVAPTVRAAAVRAWLALLTNVQATHLLTVGNAAASASSVQLSAGAEALKPLAPLALQAVAGMLEAGNEVRERADSRACMCNRLDDWLRPHHWMLCDLGGRGAGGGADGAGGVRGECAQGLPAAP